MMKDPLHRLSTLPPRTACLSLFSRSGRFYSSAPAVPTPLCRVRLAGATGGGAFLYLSDAVALKKFISLRENLLRGGRRSRIDAQSPQRAGPNKPGRTPSLPFVARPDRDVYAIISHH